MRDRGRRGERKQGMREKERKNMEEGQMEQMEREKEVETDKKQKGQKERILSFSWANKMLNTLKKHRFWAN